MPKQKRVKNKKKDEIVVDLKQKQEADRLRSVIKNQVHPFLAEMNESIRYIKIFLHTCSVSVDQSFENKRMDIKVKDLDLLKYFDPSDPKMQMYKTFFEMFGEETLTSFGRIVKDMPQNIDNMLYFSSEQKPFNELDIDKLLG